jgi:hypothetical protein
MLNAARLSCCLEQSKRLQIQLRPAHPSLQPPP